MDAKRNIQNLALAGFMGTGKSSVGRLAAAHLRFRYVDTDSLIETRTGKRVSDIFAQEGEPAFREWEKKIVAELQSAQKTVISTGGGLIVAPDNLASLKEHSLVVCLWARAETIYEHTRRAEHRPLLKQPDPLSTIRKLLAEREPFYRQADVLISTDGRSLREITQHVLFEFHLASRART